MKNTLILTLIGLCFALNIGAVATTETVEPRIIESQRVQFSRVIHIKDAKSFKIFVHEDGTNAVIKSALKPIVQEDQFGGWTISFK